MTKPRDYDKLTERYPKLYRFTKAIDCGDGWFDIIDELSGKLEAMINEVEEEFEQTFYATQVKEKYGTLRFYMSGTTDAMDAAIHKAEYLSSKICDVCGKPGKTRGNHWVQTLCDKCHEKNDFVDKTLQSNERSIPKGKTWDHI